MVMSSSASEETQADGEQSPSPFTLGHAHHPPPQPNRYTHPPSPSFRSEHEAPSAAPAAPPPAVMSARGVVRLSMLLAADRQEGDGEGEMTTPPAAPPLTTPALT